MAGRSCYAFAEGVQRGAARTTWAYPDNRLAAAAAIAIQSNGKIVVAGGIPAALKTLLESDGVTVANNQTGFGVVRYNSNGSIDGTFNPSGGSGTGGGAITGFGNSRPGPISFVSAIALQSDGKIVAAGNTGLNAGGFVDNFAITLPGVVGGGEFTAVQAEAGLVQGVR
jgi:hypothetical protein